MKKFNKFAVAFAAALMIFGSMSVLADDSVVAIADTEADQAAAIDVEVEESAAAPSLVYLTIEGPDSTIYMGDGTFTGATAKDVISSLTEGEIDVIGIEDGYISSVNGISAGIFGGWDGWMYVAKYYAPNADGSLSLYIDVPSVGINDYAIDAPCNLVLYFADYGAPYAGTTVDENGMIKLVTYSPVYDENYNVVEFTTAPLANGEFTFTAYTTDEEGNTVLGETYVFVADENGVIELHEDMRELPNGTYFASAGKQTDKVAVVGDGEVSMPEVVRYSDIYTVDVHPTEDEIAKMKVFFLMLGMNGTKEDIAR